MNFIPVARPRMPSAAAITPYLARIDAARTYSNFGPLVSELEQRLADRLKVDPTCITSVANGTAGLTLALKAATEGRTGLCLIPSWTFVATAHAVVAAGLTPFLVDVDAATWALTPAIALSAVARIGERVAAIMPVAPFGAPADVAAWDRFTDLTGIPVVIDAAAGHDAVRPGRTPSVVSLHATKILGAGEGGYVVCTQPDLIRAVKQRSNFGFNGTRNAEVVACNAKMSEYHAAVGLASMDCYEAEIASFKAVAQSYRTSLLDHANIQFQPGFGTTWCGSVIVARFVAGDEAHFASHLRDGGVDSRLWWGKGVHAQTAFHQTPHLPLTTTQVLARETLGLPFYADMTEGEIAHICGLIDSAQRPASWLTRAA